MLTLGGIMMALFLSALDQTVVSTSMPRIVADLGGFDRFTWVTMAYLLASTSVLAGLSQSMTQIIVFRAVQGVGGGLIFANVFASVGDLFAPGDRGKAHGYISGVFGLSSVIGPTLGGFITDQLSWHWIFYVNIPLGIPIILLFIAFFPKLRLEKVSHRIDYLGMMALLLSVVPLMLGLSWGESSTPGPRRKWRDFWRSRLLWPGCSS